MIRSNGSHGHRLHGAWLVLALGSLSPALFAQGPLDREITFVRALAKEMRFIELAKGEAERLATEFRGASDQDKIAQLSVEITYYGARSRSDRAQQRVLFKETVDKSKELIERSGDAAVQLEARTTLANASQDFGQFLVEELEIARAENPDKVKDLETEATAVFRAGIEACDKVMGILKGLRSDPQKQVEFGLMWMKKAVLSREQGRADKANRSVLVQRSIDELTELVLEFGEETAIGLRGLFEIAQCREVDGNIVDAISSYRATVNQIATSLKQAREGEISMPGEMQGFLFEMMQEVYVRTGEVMVREGSPETGALFTEFRANMKEFGDEKAELFDVVSDQHGHLMLLSESKFLAESGDPKKVADAMAMTKRINDKHPADYVGVRAKAVLRDILAVQQNLVSGSLMFEVAKGELQNKNYEAAIQGTRRVLATLSAEEQKQLGLEGYKMLGLAYAYSNRYLEAAIALTTGLQKYGNNDKAMASDVADALDRAVTQLKKATKNDTALNGVYDAATNQIRVFGGAIGDTLSWKDGNNLMTEKKYVEAIAKFKQIAAGSMFYEPAQVSIARAGAATGDFTAARAALTAYREWAKANEIKASDSGKLQARTAAMTLGEFIETQMAYIEARGNEELKIKKDLTKYPAALEKAAAFVSNFGKDNDGNVPTALEYMCRLHADLGALDRAEEAYTQLKQKDAVRGARLATDIFKEYQNQVKLLTDELNQAIAKDKGEAAISKALADVNAMKSKMVTLGMDYIASSPKPQLGVLVATLVGHEDLADWKRVDEVAQKTLALYGTDATEQTKKVIDQLVRPKVGEALLQQERFQEAYDMLVAAEKANPTQWELKRQISRALGGWYYFDKTGTGRKVAGMDKPADAYTKYYGEYRTWALRPEVKQFSLEWYRFQWETYWFARQAGLKGDSKFKDIADKVYRITRSTDDFKTLQSHGIEGLKLFRYFQSNR